MIDFKIDKINKFQMHDIDTLEPIMILDDCSATIESEVDMSSLSKEKLSFNHELTCSVDCCSFDIGSLTSPNNYMNPRIYYNVPIMVQARWHKKNRINKKWLKRYGMKKDNIQVDCDVPSISPNTNEDPNNMTQQVEFGMTLNNMRYNLRPDQLRRNLKIEMCYE